MQGALLLHTHSFPVLAPQSQLLEVISQSCLVTPTPGEVLGFGGGAVKGMDGTTKPNGWRRLLGDSRGSTAQDPS